MSNVSSGDFCAKPLAPTGLAITTNPSVSARNSPRDLCVVVFFPRQKREELAQRVAEERTRREEEARRLEAEQAREREEQLRQQAEERARREREEMERLVKQVGSGDPGWPRARMGRGCHPDEQRKMGSVLLAFFSACARSPAALWLLPLGTPSDGRSRPSQPVCKKHVTIDCFQKEEEARVREEAERARQEREKHFQREEQERLERKKVVASNAEDWSPNCSDSTLEAV